MPRGYSSTQSCPLPWLSGLDWPGRLCLGGLCPFGSVTGHAAESVGGVGLAVPPGSVGRTDEALVGEVAVVCPAVSPVHAASSNARRTTDPRTPPVQRAGHRGSSTG